MQRMIWVGVAAAVLAGGAMAVDSDQSMEKQQQMFQGLDQDRNGYLSHPEVRGKHRVFYYYQRADSNSDGHLDRSEFSAFESEFPPFE